jgi:hypothetical protein
MIYLPKSQPAPACLEAEKMKAKGDHNCGDVLATLRKDFKDKCYICEEKYITSINTEHFIPHRGNKDLQFSWDNLFFSCYYCNNIKGHDKVFDDILNCTNETDGVDTKIKYQIDSFPKPKAIITAEENNQRVYNTVTLLNRIYNGNTPLKVIGAENLKAKITSEIAYFQGLLTDYFSSKTDEEENKKIKNDVIDHLSPSSHFTAFKRWVIRENNKYYSEFRDYL